MNAIVLAGGRGTRLAPWPAPKCLMPVSGVPILLRLIEHLERWWPERIQSIKVCVGYRASDVVSAVQYSRWGAKAYDGVVSFSDAGEFASMGTRLVKAYGELGDKGRVLICYGDELADVDLDRLMAVHEYAPRCSMSFACAEQKSAGGVVEKRSGFSGVIIHEGVEQLVNIGFALVEPECWVSLRPEDGLSDWVNRESERSKVGLYHHRGKRATVNSLADLRTAEETWK